MPIMNVINNIGFAANVIVGNIDTRTEATFIIAHRLNTIHDADKIMVISEGEIVEAGSHTELINKKGRYYQMFNSVG